MTKAAEEGKGEQSLFHGLTTPDLAVLDILTVGYSAPAATGPSPAAAAASPPAEER